MREFKYYKIVLSLAAIFMIVSCHKDGEETNLVNTSIPSPEIVELITGNLNVYITDNDGEAIEGVQVFVYDAQVETNKFGFASFENINLDRNGTFIRALKEDYLFGSDRFFPSGTDNNAIIRLFPIDNTASFDVSSTVELELGLGGSIQIPANSLENQDGSPYTGQATLKSYTNRNVESFIYDFLPGNLWGISKSGSYKVLANYAYFDFQLLDASGSLLKLKDGQQVYVSIPVDESVSGNIASTLSTWKFDYSTGLWIEQNVLTLENNNLVGYVNSTGSWTSAKAHNFAHFTVKLVSSEGDILVNQLIEVKTDVGVFASYTDQNGFLHGKIPTDISFSISVKNPSCSEELWVKEYSGFSDNVVLDDIVIDVSDLTAVNGVFVCSGVASSDVKLRVKTYANTYFYQTNNQGEFEFKLLESLCNPELEIELSTYDASSLEIFESYTLTYSAATGLLYDICADCDFTLSLLTSSLDNCSAATNIFAEVSSGSGEYDFMWDDGSSNQSFDTSTSGTYCVTVTDVITECEQVSCATVNDYNELAIVSSSFANIGCIDYGYIDITVEGGTKPYTYNWIGPDLFTFSEEDIFDLTQEGVYTVVVLDAFDCETSSSFDVILDGGTYLIGINTNDNNNVICGDDPKFLSLFCDGCPLDLSTAVWELPDGGTDFGEEIIATQEGIYNVSINSGGCSGSGVIQLQKAEIETPIVDFVCDGNGSYDAIVLNENPNHTYAWSKLSYGELILDFTVKSSPYLVVTSEYMSCIKDFTFDLPAADGLIIDSVNMVSCQGCSDGFIEVIDDNVDCTACEYNTYHIYSESDFQTDLKIVNTEKMMTAGIYYLVGKSLDNCVVYSTQFEL